MEYRTETLDIKQKMLIVAKQTLPFINIIKKELIKIQNDLLAIGSALANTKVSSKELAVGGLSKRVGEFEGLIDKMTVLMPKLKNFILPGGGGR